MIGQLKENGIKLKKIFIESKLPKALEPLNDLAHNLWWSWQKDAIALFKSIDPEKWEALNYNPIAQLDQMSVETTQRLLNDQTFMKQLKAIDKSFKAYLKEKPTPKSPSIAYFSMEYGLHISVRLYSGGLGVLAGDFLKEASDMNVDMTAVGLLYRYGYFQQALSLHGDQINNYPPQQFTKLPLSPVKNTQGEWLKINIGLQGRMVFAKVWELKVGRISLYLLDTDIDENSWEDRSLTHQLYGGNNEHRLKQEILLGIGGTRALKALNIETDIYHCNEGHAAFLGIERLRNLVQEHQLSFEEALEVVRGSALFTTHTPVPAGHDYFSEPLLKSYLYQYAYDLGISWERFVALGKIDPTNLHENFSMSHLAIRLSQEVNGVSELHGTVSQEMFNVLFPNYNAKELHIGYVTNSVHYPTWIAKEWHNLFVDTFGKQFLSDQSNKDYWRKIQKVPAEKIASIRQILKKRLLDYVKAKLQEDFTRRGENPKVIFEILNAINEKALVFGFARRFATYKRAHLLFSNLERLEKIVNNPEKPVMFIFSGKAHPADQGGQSLIKRIIEVSKQPAFAGKIIFLENYNMESAKLLVQGVDVWLNTPTRPKEASGTSGMKAAMNGVMNFSVLDGWWAEGYRPDAGWALPLEKTYENQELQNVLDAETIYNTLETDIVPTYFDQDEQGISAPWVAYIKNIIAEVAPEFTMKRMMDHYLERFYNKLAERSRSIQQNNFKLASQIASWKTQIQQNWNEIEVVNREVLDTDNHSLTLGETLTPSIQLYLNQIPAEYIGVEIVFFKRIDEQKLELQFSKDLELAKTSGQIATYTTTVDPKLSGVYEYGFRVAPKHPLLPHPMDFNLAMWI